METQKDNIIDITDKLATQNLLEEYEKEYEITKVIEFLKSLSPEVEAGQYEYDISDLIDYQYREIATALLKEISADKIINSSKNDQLTFELIKKYIRDYVQALDENKRVSNKTLNENITPTFSVTEDAGQALINEYTQEGRVISVMKYIINNFIKKEMFVNLGNDELLRDISETILFELDEQAKKESKTFDVTELKTEVGIESPYYYSIKEYLEKRSIRQKLGISSVAKVIGTKEEIPFAVVESVENDVEKKNTLILRLKKYIAVISACAICITSGVLISSHNKDKHNSDYKDQIVGMLLEGNTDITTHLDNLFRDQTDYNKNEIHSIMVQSMKIPDNEPLMSAIKKSNIYAENREDDYYYDELLLASYIKNAVDTDYRFLDLALSHAYGGIQYNCLEITNNAYNSATTHLLGKENTPEKLKTVLSQCPHLLDYMAQRVLTPEDRNYEEVMNAIEEYKSFSEASIPFENLSKDSQKVLQDLIGEFNYGDEKYNLDAFLGQDKSEPGRK